MLSCHIKANYVGVKFKVQEMLGVQACKGGCPTTNSPDEDCTRLYSLRECISFVSDAPLLRGKKFSSSWQPIAFALDVVRQGPFSNGGPDNVYDILRQRSMPVVLFVKANDIAGLL
ncbi:hypothetical protein NC651_021504 [Populus alba x Populus x berolinensis]|nr:hypothetical protein NC651_021504 [Populus alba x Populus x berolinensis]